jgi:hypothetical protein
MRQTTPRDEARQYDFFISFTDADKEWADWVAALVPEVPNAASHPCTVFYQRVHFVPGSNWVSLIEEGLRYSERILLILSSAYLDASHFGAAEWQAAWVSDPNGLRRHLVPIRVRDCRLTGLLGGIVNIDLVGLSEDAARSAVLRGLHATIHGSWRRDPPRFPGVDS